MRKFLLSEKKQKNKKGITVMTTEKLHEILDDENRELTIEELCQVLYELKTDCFQKYSEEFEANKIPTSQF